MPLHGYRQDEKAHEGCCLDKGGPTPGEIPPRRRNFLTSLGDHLVKKISPTELEVGCQRVTREDLEDLVYTMETEREEKKIKVGDYVASKVDCGVVRLGECGRVVKIVTPEPCILVDFPVFNRARSSGTHYGIHKGHGVWLDTCELERTS